MREDLTPDRVRAARVVAVAADLLQLALVPTFFPAILSPAVEVIDLVAAVVLFRLVGWHWAFLPTFVAELIPIVDLVPTWTAAVFLATRGVAAPPSPEVVVDGSPRLDEGKALRAGPQVPRGPSGS